MLKGKVKIRLTDVKTGKIVEREEHNIITNAVSELMQCWITSNQPINSFITPIATKTLGGLLLFDGALSSSVSNTEFPNNVHLMAHAGQWSSSAPIGGSISPTESGAITNGYRCVWNFGTTQANGTISSLARTYNISPFYSDATACDHTPKSGGSNYGTSIFYNEANNSFYLYNVSNNTNFNIYRQEQPMNAFKVTDYAARRYGNPILVTTKTVSNFGNNWDKNNDGYLYNAYCNGNSSGNGSFSYQRIKYSDLSFDVSEVINVTLNDIQLREQVVSISGNKAILLGNNQRYSYIVDLSNTSNIITVDAGENSYFVRYNYNNGKSFFGNGNGIFRTTVEHLTGEGNQQRNCMLAIIYGDGTLKESETWKSGSGYIYNYNVNFSRAKLYKQLDVGYHGFNDWSEDKRVFKVIISSEHHLITDYLGTICNLASPVVKNNTQTMKITYDLIDV